MYSTLSLVCQRSTSSWYERLNLTLRIERRHLAAGPQAGVDGEDRDGPERRREEQRFQVLREDADGFLVGAVLELAPQLALERRQEQPLLGLGEREVELAAQHG